MQTEGQDQLRSRVAQLNEYREWAALVRRQTGKSLPTQLREISTLRMTGGRCGVSDYYWYRLYDDDYLLGRGRRDFLGWRMQADFSLALNPRNAVLPAWDKLVFVVLARAAGLPVAPIRACFHRSERISDALGRHLKSKEEVGGFLRDPSIYPLFGKPAFSQQGYGSAYLCGYDPATDGLRLLDDRTISCDEFLTRLDRSVDHRYHKPECGYLFQDPLVPAPEIRAITSWPAICGVRVICLNEPDHVKPIRAMWKIAIPPNYVDNFSLGKKGNLLADVDLLSGGVSRTINGLWPRTEILSKHPISGRLIDGFRLPGWDRILETCRAGGAVFPLMKLHYWDFALTDQGPLILELNDIGATEMAQLHGHGLLTLETREFLKRHADTEAHAWVGSL